LAISIYYRIGQLKAEKQRFGSHERVTFIHGKADWDQLIQTETMGKPGSGNLDNEEQWMKMAENEKNDVVTCEPQLVFDQRQKLVTGRPWLGKNSKCSSLTKICFQCRHLSRFEAKCDIRCENISIRMFIWSSLTISLFSRFFTDIYVLINSAILQGPAQNSGAISNDPVVGGEHCYWAQRSTATEK
jgi:hypothetical protein